MQTPSKHERDARDLMELLGTGGQIDPFSKSGAFGLEDAYGVVNAVRDLRLARGEMPVGRKIGFTNRAIWGALGISAPIWNYMFDTTVTDVGRVGARADLAGMPEPRIEPEIVLHLARPPEPGMSVSQLLDCLDWVAPGFEVVFSIFPGWEFSAADAAAAYGVHGALFIGERLSVTPDLLTQLSTFRVTLAGDEGTLRHGTGENVLGGPLQALSFLVRELERVSGSEALRAGEVVTTGTLTEAMPLSAGQTWTAEFDGIGLQPMMLTTG